MKRGITVANTRQAKKRTRQSEKRRLRNVSQKSMMRTYIKKVLAAVDEKSYEIATEAFRQATKIIDKVADKNIIHKNKASRLKSRLSKRVKSINPQIMMAASV
jgi:small subunit ribosomal protein S20